MNGNGTFGKILTGVLIFVIGISVVGLWRMNDTVARLDERVIGMQKTVAGNTDRLRDIERLLVGTR